MSLVPEDAVGTDRRKEVARHEEVPGGFKLKKQPGDKKTTFTIKAKHVPATPERVAASTGSARERWLLSLCKEIENFLLDLAITDANRGCQTLPIVVKFKSMGKWPLQCQMVFVLKPLTQITADRS